jgi:hypothetical protein
MKFKLKNNGGDIMEEGCDHWRTRPPFDMGPQNLIKCYLTDKSNILDLSQTTQSGTTGRTGGSTNISSTGLVLVPCRSGIYKQKVLNR